MRQTLLRSLLLCAAIESTLISEAQETNNPPPSIDPDLLNLQTARIPKEYEVAGIAVTGIHHLDTSIILSIAGIRVGDKIMIPGSDVFSRSIQSLWRQRFFSDVHIYYSRVQGNQVWVEINLVERPLLGNYRITGVSKTESEELLSKLQLVKQTIITENILRHIREVLTLYYRDKGFQNVRIGIQTEDDLSFTNAKTINIHVHKGMKLHLQEIRFFGNDRVDELKLKRQLRDTKERSRLSLYPPSVPGPYGIKKEVAFRDYLYNWGFLSFSRTKQLIEPYVRLKLFHSARFNEAKYETDKQRLIGYYNSLGYRDAVIAEDSVTIDSSRRNKGIYVDIKMNEGHKYYFGNIVWKGNAKYPDSLLNAILGISKGDTYNADILDKRLGKELSADSRDISSYYMDDGYLFFRAEAVETAVYNDTIDHEIRITEGVRARIGSVTIAGNERTKDLVIRRELTTLPGDLFRRIDIIRSTRELGALQYFNPESINPIVVPDASKGTVDINWKVEEKSSDQFEFSAGWGADMGVSGTLGLTLNNISLKKIFRRNEWDPFPQGDGQKLSLRYQSTGRMFNSYSFSFTEPWLGGRRRNSLTLSFYKSRFSNGFDPVTGLPDKEYSKNNYLKTLGASVSLGKQLKWPDDYFSFVSSLNYTRYTLKDYPSFQGMKNGVSNNISLKLALNRNSSGQNPYYPTSGSDITANVQLTPPYSLFNPGVVGSTNPYKNPEYHKWRFSIEWYSKLTRFDKPHQPVLKLAAKFGFMGRYNKNLEYSPFERFQLGDAGMTNTYGLLGYDIIAHRGYPVYTSSNPSINPEQQNVNRFFTLFNKYQVELRYPLVMNGSSTIYGLAFFEAANGWYTFKDYNPFRLRRSAGVGMRFQLPMFGLIGFDYGIGLDRLTPGGARLKNASKFIIMIGIEPD